MCIAFLRQVPLFASLSEAEVAEVAALTRVRRYEKGAFVVVAEEEGEEFFAIRRGRVKVNLLREDGREIILSLLGEGDVFGELALLDGRPRSANVVALERTEVVALPRRPFIDLLHKYPRMASALLAELAGRLRKTDLQIEGLALMNVTSRVARTLLNLVLERGVETAAGIVLERRPTHWELARMAGTTRETVTRVIRRLEREGYVRSQGRRILLLKGEFDEGRGPAGAGGTGT